MKEFFKYPRTPHIYLSGVVGDDDLLLTKIESNKYLENEIVVQEKIDGSNIGISYDLSDNLIVQNRGQIVNIENNPFFKKLDDWIKIHDDELRHVCGKQENILFGEWMYWKHSVEYDKLSSFFIAFDLLDYNSEKFYSANKLKEVLVETNISCNKPIISKKFHNYKFIDEYMQKKSKYGDSKMEGLYFRVDKKDENIARFKYVSPDFRNKITEHWRNKKLEHNYSLNSLENCWAFNYDNVKSKRKPNRQRQAF